MSVFFFFVGGATSTLSSLSSPTSSLGVSGITSGSTSASSSSACGAVGLFGGEQSRSGPLSGLAAPPRDSDDRAVVHV